jgi:hypothetical protein
LQGLQTRHDTHLVAFGVDHPQLRGRNFVIAPYALADWGCDAEYL